MKKFIACEWDTYYPSGGLGNVVGSADTLEEAKDLLLAKDAGRSWSCDNAAIYDRDSLQEVWERDE